MRQFQEIGRGIVHKVTIMVQTQRVGHIVGVLVLAFFFNGLSFLVKNKFQSLQKYGNVLNYNSSNLKEYVITLDTH